MDVARWERIQEIFHQVSDLPASEQQDYLRTACAATICSLAEHLKPCWRETHMAGSILDGGLPPLAQTLLDLPGSVAGERFRPLPDCQPLGEGGMGIVYLAKREDIGSLVAIKLLRDGLLSPDRRQRFASEQKTLAQAAASL